MTAEDPARGPESIEPPADLEPDADLGPDADLEPAAVTDEATRGRVALLHTWVPRAVAGVILLIAIVVVAIVVSGGGDDQAPSAATPSSTTQARSSGDATAAWRAGLALLDAAKYGDYWGTWTSASQTSLPRDDYVALLAPCHNPGGAATFAQQLQLTVEGDDAYLPLNRSARGNPVLHYENDRWRRVVDTNLIRSNPCGAAPD